MEQYANFVAAKYLNTLSDDNMGTVLTLSNTILEHIYVYTYIFISLYIYMCVYVCVYTHIYIKYV